MGRAERTVRCWLVTRQKFGGCWDFAGRAGTQSTHANLWSCSACGGKTLHLQFLLRFLVRVRALLLQVVRRGDLTLQWQRQSLVSQLPAHVQGGVAGERQWPRLQIAPL